MKAIIKENIIENVEFGVDSRYQDNKERESDSILLMQARLERNKNLSKEQIIRAKLLQLKLQMENYIKAPVNDNQNHFTKFLEAYVDTIYSKRSEFAKDINITPILLSQVINNHRDANEEFILKLIIHSEKAFKEIARFDKTIWHEIYFKEKIFTTMSNPEKWRPRIEKQVKLNASF